MTNFKMYMSILTFRKQKETILASKRAQRLGSHTSPTIAPVFEPSSRSKELDKASLYASRLISTYTLYHCIMLIIYPASKFYLYQLKGDISIAHQIDMVAATLSSLQIVWICMLARAFSHLAIGDLVTKKVAANNTDALAKTEIMNCI